MLFYELLQRVRLTADFVLPTLVYVLPTLVYVLPTLVKVLPTLVNLRTKGRLFIIKLSMNDIF